MARIRTIKPAFFRAHALYVAEFKANQGRAPSDYLSVRVAFAGLFTVADRLGRFVWQVAELKLDCLPYDAVDFNEVLAVLAAGPKPFIARYEVRGAAYGVIPGFLRHQRPKVDEALSQIPEPPAGLIEGLGDQLSLIGGDGHEPESDRSTDGVQSAQGREGKGREGKGRELSTDVRARTARFTPPNIEEVRAYCSERGNKVDAQKWLDYYTSNGWKVGRNAMKDWRAAVRTWERNDNGRGAAGTVRGGVGGGGSVRTGAAPGKYAGLERGGG